jgi:Xrn1 helical domain
MPRLSVCLSGGGRGQPAREILENPCAEHFILFQIGLLRDYLELEFAADGLPFRFDVERVIDDFVLFCMLIGNDFLPGAAPAAHPAVYVSVCLSVCPSGTPLNPYPPRSAANAGHLGGRTGQNIPHLQAAAARNGRLPDRLRAAEPRAAADAAGAARRAGAGDAGGARAGAAEAVEQGAVCLSARLPLYHKDGNGAVRAGADEVAPTAWRMVCCTPPSLSSWHRMLRAPASACLQVWPAPRNGGQGAGLAMAQDAEWFEAKKARRGGGNSSRPGGRGTGRGGLSNGRITPQRQRPGAANGETNELDEDDQVA